MKSKENIDTEEGIEAEEEVFIEEEVPKIGIWALKPGVRNTILYIEARPSHAEFAKRYLAEVAPAFRCLALSFDELDAKLPDELHTIGFVIIFLDRARPDFKTAMASGGIVAQDLRHLFKGRPVEIIVCTTVTHAMNHLLRSGCNRSLYKPPGKEGLESFVRLLAAH